jgi:hypothetical protein
VGRDLFDTVVPLEQEINPYGCHSENPSSPTLGE